MPYDMEASRQRWDDQIKRFGNLAVLRQPGMADRPVSVDIGNYSAIERLGGVSNPVDRKAVMSALDPGTGQPLDPNPSEKDILVTFKADNSIDEMLKIVAPPTRIGPTRIVLYWRLQVRA